MGFSFRTISLGGIAAVAMLLGPASALGQLVPTDEGEMIAASTVSEPVNLGAGGEAIPAEFADRVAARRPAWYFQLEGLALKQDRSSVTPFQALVSRSFADDGNGTFVATDTLSAALGMGDLDGGFQGGGRALLGRTLGEYHALEVSYFQVATWSDIAAVRDDTEFISEVDANGVPTVTFPASLFSPFSDFGDPAIVGLDYNSLATISYTSSLDNIEWNLRRWFVVGDKTMQVSALIGGRYTNVDEMFNYHTVSAIPLAAGSTNDITVDTSNRMIGVQAGAAFKFYADRPWWIDCEVKGVAYSNRASQRTVFVHDGVAAYLGTHTGSREETVSTFALDLNLSLTVLVTSRLAIRGGYQAFWIDGLALAPENFNRNVDSLVSGPALLDASGRAVYHGPHLGVTWIF